MYIIEKEYIDDKYLLYKSRILDFYFDKKTVGVLDIETTGLNPQTSNFILGGLLIYSESGVTVKQYFAETIKEEKQTLIAFLADVKKLDIIITYNGKYFDINFLKTRIFELGILEDYQFPYNFDLYLVLNGHSSLRKLLPNLKQKTIESFMGLWASRKDEISGAESVELYQRYLSTGNKDLREIILLHNRDDVLQLSQLLPILEKVDIHKAFFKLGFPVDCLYITKISLDSKELKVWGQQSNPISYTAYCLDDCSCLLDFDRYSKEFFLAIPIIRRSVLSIIDTKAFEKDFSQLEKYETFENGFLVLQQRNTINYTEINHFIKLLLERLLKVMKS